MRKFCFIYIALVLLFALVFSSCTNDPGTTPVTPDTPEDQKPALVYSREYWGEWKKMDQTETWLINSTSIKVNGNTLESEVSLSKPSENVISVTINGQTDCLYAVRTASSSITGNVTTGETARALSAGYASVIVQNINDANDKVETTTDANGDFTAENLIVGENYNVKIGDTSLNVIPSFDGEDIGTITLMSGVNFKVTLTNNNNVMYAGSEYYSMDLIIENIGDTNCTAATYALTGDDGLDVINNYTDGVLLRTVAAGETKVIPLRVKCSSIEKETAKKKLNLVITDRNGTKWNDSVSLKFNRDNVTINVISENGRPISGVIIGDGRTYSITNRTNYSISIPVTAESYLMVFSGAIANASRNTESAYSIGVNCSATTANNLLTELGTETNSSEPNDDENHAKSIIFGKSIVSYLFENDIDYYFLEPVHLWDAGVKTKDATCTETGAITHTCTVCGETYTETIPATGHSFSTEWSKDAEYHWHASTCGHDVISDKTSHTWKEKTVTIAPTFTSEGERILSCTVCGQEKTETVPKLTYKVGDIGPAGGYIFYDCDADNDSGNADGLISTECGWRYLEAAPADLRIVEGVPTINSSLAGYSDAPTSYRFGYFRNDPDGDNLFINGTAEYDASNCTTESVGSGLKNTSLLVSVMSNKTYKEQSGSETITDYAAKLCYDLVHVVNESSFNDWFLPSKDEVILMYSNLKSEGIGDFADAYYWSSYEGKNTTTGVWGMNFQHESKSEYYRSAEYHVRPVRAFLLDEIEGHQFTSETIKAPSCTESGFARYTCSGCGYSYEIMIPSLGHSFSNKWSKDETYHWRVSTCGHDVVTDKATHDWDDGTTLLEATHTTDGQTKYTCTVCGATKIVILPSLVDAHEFSNEWVYDADYHWHEATCGHDVVGGKAEHSFNNNHVCTECGFIDYSYMLSARMVNADSVAISVINEYKNSLPSTLYIPSKKAGYIVRVVDSEGFKDCDTLVSVIMPDTVHSIWTGAFEDCSNLVSVCLPDSFLNLESRAFYNCSKLETINLPLSDYPIPNFAFFDCINLACSITIPGVDIGEYAFSGCTSLTDVTITYGTETIGRNAFFNSGIEQLTIPNSVSEIGRDAFSNCSNLSSINIPTSLERIEYGVFGACPSLTSIEIPETVTFIENCAFACSGLKSITVPSSVTYLGYAAFRGCSDLESAYLANTDSQLEDEMFKDCTSLRTVMLPETLNSIRSSAFMNCTSLETIVIPASDLSTYVFKGCTNLKNITLSAGTTALRTGCFEDCSAIEEIVVPNTVWGIGQDSFKGCSSLASVTIPTSVTNIYDNAFYGCAETLLITYDGYESGWSNINKTSSWDNGITHLNIQFRSGLVHYY